MVPLALLMSGAALADDSASVKKSLETSLNGIMASFKKKDIKGVVAPIADDYKGSGMMGEPQDKKTVTEQMKMHMATTKSIKTAKYTVSDVKVAGDKATAKLNFKLDAMVTMMDPKKAQHLQLEENTSSTWAKRGGKWLMTGDKPLSPAKMLVDGKPFNPGAPPR
jgi:hypothetical protein